MNSEVLMIHGSNGSQDTIAPLATALKAYAKVHTPNLLGHGGRPIPARFDIDDFARDLVGWMDQREIQKTFVFGYSFGGYIAWYLARHFPERVLGVATLASKFYFDPKTVRHWRFLAVREGFDGPDSESRWRMLDERHAPQDWRKLIEPKVELFKRMGENPPLTEADMRALQPPALFISGDADQLVRKEETLALAGMTPGAQTRFFEGVAHPLEAAPLAAVARLLSVWMDWVQNGGRQARPGLRLSSVIPAQMIGLRSAQVLN